MSRGQPISQGAWPAAGPMLDWLRHLDRIHRDNGLRSQRDIAKAMGLSSPTRVGLLIGGRALPADAAQARSLQTALGGLDDETDRGLRLYRKAAAHQEQRTETPAWWERSGYLDRVRDLAPRELLGRDTELDTLAEFCGGDVTCARWQAPARAGKTALFSWFALHPPPDTWVLSFFVTARLAGQSDSTAFSDAMLDQLAALTGETVPPGALAGAREGMRRQLLRVALRRAATAGRRLVILVDGLDEDRGVRPGSGLASIASLLPRRPEPHLRVLVAGRPDPPLPADVDVDHLLHEAVVHDLAPSPYARRVALLAAEELKEALAGPDRLNEEVLGLVTAAGGGLTGDDVEQLTGRARYELDTLLHGVFGRTLAERGSVFHYTHETLREQAVHRFGNHKLGQYRDRLAAWARTFRDSGWPPSTPDYLLRSYQLMLADAADLPGLVALGTDWARHDRMLAVTGGDTAALAEIAAAQHLVARQPAPDLVIAARLAFHRDALTARNLAVPVRLPAVWALLGHQVRATAMADGITDSHRRALAHAALASAIARHLTPPSAELGCCEPARAAAEAALEAAETVADRFRRAEALASAAQAMADAGDHARARSITDRIENDLYRAEALVALAEAAARHGDLPAATALAREITNPLKRGYALAAVAGHTDSPEDAAALAREISHPLHRAYVLARAGHLADAETIVDQQGGAHPSGAVYDLARAHAAISAAATRAGDPGAAARHAELAGHTARQVRACWRTSMAVVLADATGEHRYLEEAAVQARAIADPDRRANALAVLAEAAARHCMEFAAELAEESGAAARGAVDVYALRLHFGVLTEAMIDAGDLDRAERLAREAPPSERGALLAQLAAAHLHAGDLARGCAIAGAALDDEHPNTYRRDKLLTGLPALMSALDITTAVRFCERLDADHHRAAAALSLAKAIGERDPASAARLVRSAASEWNDADTLAPLAALGNVDEALALAGQQAEEWQRQLARVEIFRAAPTPELAAVIEADMTEDTRRYGFAEALAEAGMTEAAERVTGHVADADDRAVIHARMAATIATKDPARAADWAATAERTARALPEGFGRDHALRSVAQAYHRLGDVRAVCRVVAGIDSVSTRVEAAVDIGSPDLIMIADTDIAAITDAREQDRLRAELARISPAGAAHARRITDAGLRAATLAALPGHLIEALGHAHWQHCVQELASRVPEAAVAVTDEFLTAQPAEPVVARTASGALILVIDDDLNITEVIRRMLTRAGHDVEVRFEGESGVHAAVASRPDLVLTGIVNPPGWSGWQMIEHLRPVSDVPIMVVTGQNRDDPRAHACGVGAGAFLAKPFTAAALDTAVEGLLNRSDRPASWL